MGTTGSSTEGAMNQELPNIVARVRQYAKVPLAVGFGVATRDHFNIVANAGADGVVIGSRIVTVIKEAPPKPSRRGRPEVLRRNQPKRTTTQNQYGAERRSDNASRQCQSRRAFDWQHLLRTNSPSSTFRSIWWSIRSRSACRLSCRTRGCPQGGNG